MYQFRVPSPEKVIVVKQDPTTKQTTSVEADYTFDHFLSEFVWASPAWRVSAEASDAWYIAQEKLTAPVPGAAILLDDTTWGFFKPIATLAGKDLPQSFSHQLSRLMRPILQARQVTTRDLEDQDALGTKAK